MNTLALFPLQIVVFPGEKLNLHIFEPRYRALVKDCETEGISFGVNAFMNDRLQSIGTEVQLESVVKRYEDGRLDIQTKGKRIYEIKKFYKELPGKQYAGGVIDWQDTSMEGDSLMAQKMETLVLELFDLLKVEKEIPSASELKSFDIAHHVGLPMSQEYNILAMAEEVDRQALLIEHLEHIIPIAKEMEELKRKIKLNGHFKNFTPLKL